ncbi:IPTL-CTERM sorting domain-containing protein [Ottowia thiooxydans]|nr:IPTL-CTERM sorting domain-containing protein [Ottowia thiooxydans]
MTVTAQFAIASAIPVPSLKEGTLALLGLLAGVLGLWRLRRRGNAM